MSFYRLRLLVCWSDEENCGKFSSGAYCAPALVLHCLICLGFDVSTKGPFSPKQVKLQAISLRVLNQPISLQKYVNSEKDLIKTCDLYVFFQNSAGTHFNMPMVVVLKFINK